MLRIVCVKFSDCSDMELMKTYQSTCTGLRTCIDCQLALSALSSWLKWVSGERSLRKRDVHYLAVGKKWKIIVLWHFFFLFDSMHFALLRLLTPMQVCLSEFVCKFTGWREN